jgi:hypothetical protein
VASLREFSRSKQPHAGAAVIVLAELEELRAQRAAVLKLADAAEHNCTRWQDPLPVSEWVGRVRKALGVEG